MMTTEQDTTGNVERADDRTERLIRDGFNPDAAADAAELIELLGHEVAFDLLPGNAAGRWEVALPGGPELGDRFVVLEVGTDLPGARLPAGRDMDARQTCAGDRSRTGLRP